MYVVLLKPLWRAVFLKTGLAWTDILGTLTISADVFPVVAPEKLLFGWSGSNWRPEIRLRLQVSGRMADSCKKIFSFKTMRIRCRKECGRMGQKEVTHEQALERTLPRAAKPRGAEEELLSPHLWHLHLLSRAVLAWLLATLPYGELARRLKRRGIFFSPLSSLRLPTWAGVSCVETNLYN